MKLKCPGCATLLNVLDSAAGKVVKCPCGKQLRAPGGKAPVAPVGPRAGAAAGAPRAARSVVRPAAPQQPAPQGGAGGLDDGMFDELTDGDLKKPVVAVARPGMKKQPAATASSGKLMQQYGPTASNARSTPSPRSSGRTAGAVICLVLAVLLFMVATRNVFFDGPSRPDNTSALVGYAVGSYLVPILFLAGGLHLLRRPRQG